MKKQTKGLVAGAALLVALSGLWIFLANTPAEEEAPPEETLYVAGNSAPIQVTAIEVQSSRESYRLTASGEDSMTVDGWGGLPLNGELLGKAREEAAAISAKSVVVQEDADLSKYGLATPSVKVTISVEGQNDQTLLVGNEAPGSVGVYVAVQGQAPVYLVEAKSIAFAIRSKSEYVSLLATRKDDPTNPPVLVSAILTGGGRESAVKISDQADPAAESASYRMTAPVSYNVSINAMMMLDGVSSITAGGVAAVDPTQQQLEDCGLVEPYSTAAVTFSDGNTITLLASQPREGGVIYFMVEGRPVIYLGDSAVLPWVEMQYYEFMSPIVVSIPLDQLDRLQIVTPSKTWDYAISGEGDAMTVVSGGQTLDSTQFKRMNQGVQSITLQEHTDQRPQGEPVMTFIYTLTDGSSQQVVLYEGPVRKLFVTTGDLEPQFLVASSFMDKVLENAGRLAAGEVLQTIY